VRSPSLAGVLSFAVFTDNDPVEVTVLSIS
jgi:hypothetical protein